ncbi:MFS transporter [Haloactinopolyspora alba]|uniref:MFS transporter n=1 Tax=Haloactinopolyspora alba TaxID=648780 RepID=A0A2P8DWB9_9ACTN|nr:MFS transporter [Haloactinopolyspora alba]PSL01515.1 MFS transporter [Haloactinopolyspora alba]
MTVTATTSRRTSPLRPGGFYGWHIVVGSTVALAATGPGQTAGVSVFIDPLIVDLGVSRSAISTAYLIGTLCGAFTLPWIGRALDRYGVRRTMATIGLVFGAVLMLLATASGIVGLTAGFVGIRMAGQGALGLTATTATALWFSRRRGTATGIVTAFGAIGISMTPLLMEGFVAEHGWRTAWLVEGLAIWAIVIPLALLGMRDRPADLGQLPDGAQAPEPGETHEHVEWGVTVREAVRTPFFWVVAGGVAACGLLSTAINFHQISLLSERGLTTAEAAGNFLWQTIAALLATLATGALSDRVKPRWLIAASMVALAGSLVLGSRVEPGLSAIAFGALLGSAGGAMRALEAATFPRYYGTTHLGSIRGMVTAVSVGSTAFGPLLFSAAHELTDAYTTILVATAPIPLVIAFTAFVVRPPSLAPHHDSTSTNTSTDTNP